jgi:hypothetical protein
MPGVRVICATDGVNQLLNISSGADRVTIKGLNIEVQANVTSALEIDANDCFVSETRVNMNGTGKTLTNAINLASTSNRSYVNASVRTTLGTMTTKLNDLGTDNYYNVRG